VSSIDSSSVSPFAKYSCSSSPVKFERGRTMIPGLCDEVNSASPISAVGLESESKLGMINGL
jgi:hypothetical protein